MSDGHVFIVRGDLTRVDCDVWLCPTDRRMVVEGVWRVPSQAPPDGWGERVRAVPAAGGRVPLPVLTDVGGVGDEAPQWYRAGVQAFLDVALRAAGTPSHNRDRPLLALPVVGTGEGGARDRRGEMTTAILEELYAWTAEHRADVVLVTRDERAHAAAQAVRRRMERERGDRALWDLDDGLVSESMRLAKEVRERRLVLFLGAGIGFGAGLPSWNTLLTQLAEDAGLGDELEALARIQSPMDRAALIAGRLRGSVGRAVAARFEGATHVSLTHAILAGLPVEEAATTNYDRLFETACADAGRHLAVLPYADARSGGAGWLLKLHGSVDHPDDIVLTRADYLSYASERAALRGLVQALLITRHMLFVGFSLTDENFHQVVHDVRLAIRSRDRPGGEFGTALMIEADDLSQELWRGEVALTPVGTGRTLEIFLDHMLCHAIDNTPHLLDETYGALLTTGERHQADALRRLGALAAATEDPSWDPVRRFLRERGWSDPGAPTPG